MASTTTNIGLTKPAGTDQALISAINGNMDIIDTKMGAVGNTSVQGQITALSDQIGNIYEYPTGLTTLIGLSSNVYIESGKEKTYSAENSVITTLTDWPSALSSYKFCATIKIQRTTSNRYIYQITSVSGGGIPKTVYGYALSGTIIWNE